MSVLGQAAPLIGGEFHPPPVVVAGRVLWREFDAKLFGRRAFGGRDVGLKFDRVGACRGHGVDVRMRRTQAAIVSLPDLGHDERRVAGPNEHWADLECCSEWNQGRGWQRRCQPGVRC